MVPPYTPSSKLTRILRPREGLTYAWLRFRNVFGSCLEPPSPPRAELFTIFWHGWGTVEGGEGLGLIEGGTRGVVVEMETTLVLLWRNKRGSNRKHHQASNSEDLKVSTTGCFQHVDGFQGRAEGSIE
eukprot:356744-Amorphochlora_amoeboformis.AAC.1